MRIAHFVSGFPVLSETFVYDEIQAFAEEGFENVIVDLRPPPKEIRSQEEEYQVLGRRPRQDLGIVDVLDPTLSPLAGIARLLGAPSATLRVQASLLGAAISTPGEFFQLLWTLQRALEAIPKLLELEVVHCHAHFAHYPASMGWACARLLRRSFSWNAHGYDVYRYRGHLRTKIRDADLIFPIAERNRDFILEVGKGIPDLSDRVTVCRCGIDLEDYPFHPSPPPGEGKVPLIVTVGRLVDIKGFQTLIEAASLLAQQGTKVEVEIVGDGPDKKSLEAQIKSAGLTDRVRLLGSLSRSETRMKQQQADLIVQPSRPGHHGPEGIPVVLMEAMALGKPVVSTRFAAIPELVEDGVAGRLAPPNDPPALARILSECLREGPSREMLDRARSRVEARHHGPRNFQAKAKRIRELVQVR